jgi:putative ABC transport system permease protein
MSLWRQVTRGLRALTNRSATDRDVTDEVQHYVDEATAAHMARGLSREAAQRAATIEIGNLTTAREQIRSYGWENVAESTLADVRYAYRRLRSTPLFTIVATLTLALGVGATTAIFSVVNPVLFEPLPYPNADRITSVAELTTDGSRNDGTFAMYKAFVARTGAFDAFAVLKPWQPTLTTREQPERLTGQRVSADYFRVFGRAPAIGRTFDAADDRAGGPNVIVLSDALWRRRFGADRSIVGREVTLDDNPFVVLGVMPPDFENVLAPDAELWGPMQYELSQGRAWGHHLRTVARLAPGVSIDRASREVQSVGQAVIAEERPPSYDPNTRFVTTRLQDDLTAGVRPALFAMIGGVLLVLVIACVNVTNLLLARGAHRRGEFAVRVALGAARGRLVRQLLTECLLLSLIGGALGMAVASIGVKALIALSPPELPRLGAIQLDGVVLAFGLLVTTLIGLAFGVTPALQAAHSDPNAELQQGSRRNVGGHQRTRRVLVVAEVALALVLLVSSGLLLRSIERLFAVTSGFDSSGIVTMQVATTGKRYRDDATRLRFFEDALAAVKRVPGVMSAGTTGLLPLSGERDEYGVHFDATPTRPARSFSSFRYAVSPGYLETMRIPLVRGRSILESDRLGAPRVALISESLARLAFPGVDPIGQRLRVGPPDGEPFTVVGVLGDVRQLSLALPRSEAVYTSAAQWFWPEVAMSIVVRTRDRGTSIAPAIRDAVWSVDKDQPVVRVATMNELLASTASSRRFALILFEIFAAAALVLAVAGIYGVLAGSVAERTREIGVRAALGASQQRVLRLVLGQGLRLTLVGIAIGLAVASVATRAMETMLFGVSRLDPVTYIGVVVVLVGASLIACAIPAWRAARVDPVRALRAD